MGGAATVATIYLRLFAAAWFGDRPVLILFTLPILLAAYFGGQKPGLVTTTLVALSAEYYVVGPKYSFSPGKWPDVLDLLILTVVGVLISVLMESLRQARTRNSAERNRADAAATELAAIVESSFDAIIGKDLNGIVTSWNAGAERVFGYLADEMVGNSITMLIPPDHLCEEEEILQRIKGGGRVEHFVTVRQRKDGEPIDVSVTVSPIKNAEGAIVGASKVARDITAGKRAEEARLISEARYRSLFENAPDGIVIADSGSRYIDANPSVCRMLGYARGEFIGLHASDIVVQNEILNIEPALSTIKAKSSYHREWRFQRKDGTTFAGEVIATMMPDGNLLGMIRDITERNIAALALREKEEQLHASDRRLADIVQGMTEACFALDTDWRFTFINDRGETLLRHSRGQMLGRTIWDVFSQLVGTPMEANYRRAMTERVPVAFEVFSPIAERWLDIRLFPTGEGLAAFLLDTHARKLGEESLRATQAQLNSTLSAGSIGTWTWDITNDRLSGDEFTARAFSIPADEAAKGLPAAAYLQAVVEEDQAAVSDGLARAIETCGNYDLEYRVRKKDGTLLWLQAKGRVEGDATGNAVSFHGAVMDITARKQMELALLESEERFRTMANSMPQLAWIGRADGFIVWYNERWYEYTGTAPGQVEGWDWQSLPDPKVLPKLMEKWTAALKTGEPFEMEFPLRGADGQFRTFLTRAHPLKNAKGRVVQWFGTNTDIEELKQAKEKVHRLNIELEERVAERTAELHENAERFRTLADNIYQLAWMADAHGAIFWFNQRWLDYTGTNLEEMRGWGWQKVSHPDHSERVVEKIRRCFESGEVWEDTFPLRGADGSFRWFLSRAVPIHDESGTVFRWFGTNTDVTSSEEAKAQISNLNGELQQRADQLETANKELEAFSYSVSHDLRAPLRHITGYINLLDESLGEACTDEGRRFLGIVADSSRLMGALIDDLLAFSRTSRVELKLEAVDLQALVKETLGQLEPDIAARQIRWRQEALPSVQADRGLLRQVLTNLLANAIKYTQPRDPAEIQIGTANHAAGEVVIYVRDNGVGFDMQYADKLFGVFQRLHSDEEFEGNGIGLANVRRIVARHGGRTWAEGEVNAGATFYFSLPYPMTNEPCLN